MNRTSVETFAAACVRPGISADDIMMEPKVWARYAGTLAIAACVLIAALFGPRLVRPGQVGPLTNPADFRAFYCAGAVVARGNDPYRIEPLRACEREKTESVGLQLLPGLVVPGPLPPYALVVFAAISRVPFLSAVCGWFAFLLAATIATAIVLRRDTRLPLVAIVAMVALVAFDAMMLGQIMPAVTILIVVAASALAKNRPWPASAALAVAMIEPHVALPAFLAAFVFRKEMRVPLAACMAIFAAPSIVLGGSNAYAEYFGHVLPLQSISETHALQAQYSLTTFLVMLCGMGDALALRLGEVDFVLTVALSIVVAKKLSDRYADARLLLYIPPAFSVFGGMYAHLYAFAIVVPAALTLVSLARGWRRIAYWAAGAGVAISTAVDEYFSEDLARHIEPSRAALAALGPNDYANEVSRLFEAVRMPDDPHAIAAIVAIKLPALLGVFALIAASTATAFFGRNALRADALAGERAT